MIRILHVVTDMNRGGLETMLMNYYRQTDRDEVQFDFLTHRPYNGDYGEEIERLGGIIYHLHKLNPFGRGYKKELKAFFEGHPEYQVIHVHQDCLSSVILKTAKECGVRVRIAHSHNADQDKNLKYPIKLFYRRKIPLYATDLMACGKNAGDWMFRNAPYRVLNNAIDSKAYSFNASVRQCKRKELGISDSQLLVGHIGRFSYQKNHEFLLDVFAETSRKCDAKLLLIGDGKLRPMIENKIRRLHLEERVIIAGIRSDVSDLLQAMDVFVFPSHYEGLGLALVEAQAAGLPCLASDKVPSECNITNSVRQLPLSDGASLWAKEVIAASRTARRDTYNDIKEAGYDIAENAKWLQNYYVKAYSGE